MQQNKKYAFKLSILVFMLIIVEIAINSTSLIYLDILGIFLLVALINKLCLFHQIIIISIIADLIGKWYLGTHLFTLILLSFIVDRYYNFYKISNLFQKNIFIILLALVHFLIMYIVGVVVHNNVIDLLSIVTEITILCPILFVISYKLLYLNPTNIFYDE